MLAFRLLHEWSLSHLLHERQTTWMAAFRSDRAQLGKGVGASGDVTSHVMFGWLGFR